MAEINVEDVLEKLTMNDKVDLLAGVDFWHTKSLPQHGIPSIRLTDGPNGVRGTKYFKGTPAACFPCGTAMGATFNVALLEEAGYHMGKEALAKSAHAILGPTVNMQRSPLGGRGFESIGEDPFLSGLGAAALIRGIQSTGVQAVIKHFLCNDGEDDRRCVQVLVTERALREIYALPFQLAVRDSQPGGFMTAYNGINGVYCSENPKYLNEMLRKEWGWDGLIMSDWFGLYSTNEAIKAGLDLDMPGPSVFRGDTLKFNVESGKPPRHFIDDRAREVLKFVKKCAALGLPERGPEATLDTPETAAFLRKVASESIVLLKNERGVLPLSKKKKTLVLGPNAVVATYSGGGSSSLSAYYTVCPYDGISEKLGTKPPFTVGAYTHKALPLLGYQTTQPNGKPGMVFKAYNEPPGQVRGEVLDEVVLTKTEVHLADYYNAKLNKVWYAELEGYLEVDEDQTYELGLVVCGRANLFVDEELVVDNHTKQRLGTYFYGTGTVEERGRVNLKKGQKYHIKVEFSSAATYSLMDESPYVPGEGGIRIGGAKIIDDQAEIAKSVQLAKDHEQVIICAGLNSDWETEGVDRESMKLPGCLDQLISEVVAANPDTVVVMQTGTPEEMPWLDQTATVVQAWYGGNETGNSIADVLFGDYNPSGKLSLSFPKKVQDVPAFLNFKSEKGRTLYGEDVYVGYRYYEFAEREVNFAFGHGLSYTTFSFSDLSIQHETGGMLKATFTIKNTGSLKGAEVAQLYVKPTPSKVNRPVKELKGFVKMELEPGESRTASIEEQEKYLASYWDEERDGWCVEKGEYEVIISNSSVVTDGALKGSFAVPKPYWWNGI